MDEYKCMYVRGGGYDRSHACEEGVRRSVEGGGGGRKKNTFFERVVPTAAILYAIPIVELGVKAAAHTLRYRRTVNITRSRCVCSQKTRAHTAESIRIYKLYYIRTGQLISF